MRRFMYAIMAVFALAVLAQPADAQLKFGGHLALSTGVDELVVNGENVNALDGTFGLGARAMVDPPLLPVGGYVSATYYFPEADISYWTGTAALQLRLPAPVVKPYGLAGWQVRNSEGESENGPMLGLGLQLDFMVSAFLEATFEFHDEIETATDFDNNPLVIKGGILFGGG